MTQLTSAHHELAHCIRWHARLLANTTGRVRFEDEVEIKAEVRGYHRKDNYRVIDILSPNQKYLEELQDVIGGLLPVKRVRYYFDPISRTRDGNFNLSISIWPEH